MLDCRSFVLLRRGYLDTVAVGGGQLPPQNDIDHPPLQHLSSCIAVAFKGQLLLMILVGATVDFHVI